MDNVIEAPIDLETRLRNYLKNTKCYIKFEKLDGTDREGYFTLQESYLNEHYTPKSTTKTKKAEIPGLVPAFDTEINQWRMINVGRIKEFAYHDTYSGLWNNVVLNQ